MPRITERSKKYRIQREQKRKKRLEKRLPKYLLESSRISYTLHLISFTGLMLTYGIKGLCTYVYGPLSSSDSVVFWLITMVRLLMAIPPVWASRDKIELLVGSCVIWLLIVLLPEMDALVVMAATACVTYLLWRSRDVYRSEM